VKYINECLYIYLPLNMLNIMKIYLFNPNPKWNKLIFYTPFRDGVIEENHYLYFGENTDDYKYFLFINKALLFLNINTLKK